MHSLCPAMVQFTKSIVQKDKGCEEKMEVVTVLV